MSLNTHAASTPDKAALISPDTGCSLSFRAVDAASRTLAALLRSKLSEGARVALLLENGPAYFIAAWACRRSALRFVPVNWHLTPDEAAYIVVNSGAEALVASSSLASLAGAIADRSPKLKLQIADGPSFGSFRNLEELLKESAASVKSVEREGSAMFYSSGTTGQPKGILRDLPHQPFGSLQRIEELMANLFGFDDATVFYSPAPLYHAAPLGWTMGTQSLGGTVVQARRFDAEDTLAHIELYGVTHAQLVPTHFVRMLKLPAEVRARYDLSTLQMVVHAGAPCPIEVKDQMLAWLGPILYEFYGASEGGGMTIVSPEEWLARKGTVGRSVTGTIHVLDDNGARLPPLAVGHIAFENPAPFVYHGEPEKTAEFFDDSGRARPGDMGWLDEEGYLYLVDRASNMIISGGVNIYPQEAEAVLTLHSAVRDVAVIGVPDEEMGEEVKAVVELAPAMEPSEALAAELMEYCRSKLANFKCPRSVDFVAELPRLPSGKLLKRQLRKKYWDQVGPEGEGTH